MDPTNEPLNEPLNEPNDPNLAGKPTCPLTTPQLTDLILECVRIYNAPAFIHLYTYQTLFVRRIIESLVLHDGDGITGLWARQCLAADTIILDRDGTACRIKDHPRAWYTGHRPVYRVRAQNGFEIRVTGDHPILTQRGWVRCGALQEDDQLCVLDQWDHFGDGHVEHESDVYVNWKRTDHYVDAFELTERHGRLLGYLTADGHSFRALEMNQSIKFTSITEIYLDEVELLIAELFPDVETKRYAKGNGFDLLCVSKQGRSAKTTSLRRFLAAMAPDDKFPTAIFRAPREAIISFLNRLFSADGCVGTGIQLACGNSRAYAHYCQLLLARLGIDSRVKSGEWMSKNTDWFYRLTIDDKTNMARFLSIVGPIFGKEEACAGLDTTFVRWSNRSYDHAPIGEDGEHRLWSRLLSVEPCGEDDVYDVTYPEKGWFFAQGIVVHNSGKSESLSSLAGALCVFLPSLALAFPGDPRLSSFIAGFKIGIFAPKQQQSQIIYERIRMRAAKEEMLGILNDPDINVHLTQSRGDQVAWSNGSSVTAQTASEQSNVEGGTYHLVFLDEAQLIGQVKVNKEIKPMLSNTNGSLVKIGTASFFKGGFHESITYNIDVAKKGGKRNHFEFPYDQVIAAKRKAFEETGDRKHLLYEAWVKKEIERLKGNVDNEEFRMNFRLMWHEANMGAIDRHDFAAAADDSYEANEPSYKKRQVAGLDVARKRDATILTIMDCDETPAQDGRMLLRPEDDTTLSDPSEFYNRRIIAWHVALGRRWQQILTSVLDFLSMYAVDTLVIDGTGIGDPIAEQLQTMAPGIQIVPFILSHIGNDTIYKKYVSAYETGRIRYPAGPRTVDTEEYQEFKRQHQILVRERSSHYSKFYASDGDHDDFCDSAALCNHAVSLVRAGETLVECTSNPFYATRGDGRRLGGRADRYR